MHRRRDIAVAVVGRTRSDHDGDLGATIGFEVAMRVVLSARCDHDLPTTIGVEVAILVVRTVKNDHDHVPAAAPPRRAPRSTS